MGRRGARLIDLTIAITAASALALTGCGSDDDAAGGGSPTAFCEGITALADSGDSTNQEQDLEAFQAMADAAPDEISDEMDQLVEAFERLQTFDPAAASEEEMAEFLAIADGLEEASTTVEKYAKDNCPDLPDGFFGSD